MNGVSILSKYADKVKKQSRSKKRETFEVDASLLDSEWIKCPKCHEELKSHNLEGHLGKVHHVKMVKGKKGKNDLLPLIGLTLAVVVIVVVGIYLLTSGDNGDDDTQSEGSKEGWLDTYSPEKGIGSSDDDWWTFYPDQHPSWGEMPDHPAWIREKLKDGPVLIFAHSDNCMPCIQQQESVNWIMKNHGDDIQLLDYLSGVDARAVEAFAAYDPNGSPNYIPLTVVITIVEDDFGNERIGWHGTEGETGDEWLSGYVKDAIYYHQENVDEWS